MIWLMWRRQRAALLATAATVAVLGVFLAVLRMRYLAHVTTFNLQPCLELQGPACEDPRWLDVRDTYSRTWINTHLVLLVTPLLLGLLGGATLFGRDLEQGTHRFALTQARTHTQWWATGVLVAVLPAALAATALASVAAWAFAPLRSAFPGWAVETPTFEDTGLVPIAYTVLVVVLAATIGLLTRSALIPIMATTILYAVVFGILAGIARPYYLPPEVSRVPVETIESPTTTPATDPSSEHGTLVLQRRYIDANGRTVPAARVFDDRCRPQPDYQPCLRNNGVVATEIHYQPKNRYWPFQLIETTILAILSAAALATGYARLRNGLH